MNILFVHETEWLNKVVFDIHSLSEALSLRGHRVCAIDYENTWEKSSFWDFGTFRTKEVKGISRAFPAASVCLRRPGIIKIPGVSRFSASITHYFEIQRTIRERGIEAIVLYSVPTNGLQSIWMAHKLGIPVLFRSIDILNQLVAHRPLRPATRLLEKKVYSRADMILTLTPKLSDYVIEKGADKSRVRTLLMPLDTGMFHPSVDSSHLRQKWGFDANDQIVLFVGTLFDFSGLDRFIPQFRSVIKEVPQAKLLIVGDGPQRSKLDRVIVECGLQDHVKITGFQPYQTMPEYMNLATVCINTFDIVETTRDIFPGKTVQYLACGKALIATALPGMIAVIPGEEQGIVYVNSTDQMADELVSLLKTPERRTKLEQAASNYVGKAHDYRVIAEQLESAIKEAISEKKIARLRN